MRLRGHLALAMASGLVVAAVVAACKQPPPPEPRLTRESLAAYLCWQKRAEQPADAGMAESSAAARQRLEQLARSDQAARSCGFASARHLDRVALRAGVALAEVLDEQFLKRYPDDKLARRRAFVLRQKKARVTLGQLAPEDLEKAQAFFARMEAKLQRLRERPKQPAPRTLDLFALELDQPPAAPSPAAGPDALDRIRRDLPAIRAEAATQPPLDESEMALAREQWGGAADAPAR